MTGLIHVLTRGEEKYVTGLIHVLTRGQADIFDWVNPCADKGTGRNM